MDYSGQYAQMDSAQQGFAWHGLALYGLLEAQAQQEAPYYKPVLMALHGYTEPWDLPHQ
jgi:hypothetical protein